MGSGRQNDHEGTTTTVDETCADVNLFAQETNEKCAKWRWHKTARKNARATSGVVHTLKHHTLRLLREYHFISCLTVPIMDNSERSNTLLETGSDILQTLSTREEVLNIYGLFKDFLSGPSHSARLTERVNPNLGKTFKWINRPHLCPNVSVHSSATHHYSRWTTVSLSLIFGFDLCCASKND